MKLHLSTLMVLFLTGIIPAITLSVGEGDSAIFSVSFVLGTQNLQKATINERKFID